MYEDIKFLEDPNAEVVFGLVSPVGTDLARFEMSLCKRLTNYGYRSLTYRVSGFFEEADLACLGTPIDKSSEATRLRTTMDAGNKIREVTKRNDFLAIYAAARVGTERQGKRLPKTAHIIRSLKHPDEARALRQIYGQGFFLIGVHANEKSRLLHLTDEGGIEHSQASALIERDHSERDEYGQQTRDTFHRADVFLPLGACR